MVHSQLRSICIWQMLNTLDRNTGHNYGVFALSTLLIFPALLMFLYPCAFFQRLLNRLGMNSLALKTVMDAYQGVYKDGTNNTRDYHWFSGIFFLSRTVVIILMSVMDSDSYISLFVTFVLILILAIALFHPQKLHLSYIMDCLFTLLAEIGLSVYNQ